MENFTRISHVNNAATAEETIARERLHAAIEQAVESYMSESKTQDIASIEMFPE